MTLRERKKELTREAIIDAAFSLFERQGFEQTTAEQIADAAAVSRRTFFRYFGTKEAVVFPDRDQRFYRFEQLLAGPAAGERPFDRVKRALFGLAEDYMDARARVRQRRLIVTASPTLQSYDRELDREWERIIAEALLPDRQVTAAERQHAVLTAGALMGGIRACLESWFDGDCRGDLVAMGHEAVDLLERGLNNDDTQKSDGPQTNHKRTDEREDREPC